MAGLLFNLWPFAVHPHADLQPDWAGELDHSHPLGMCHCRRPPASQRGHCAPASCRNQEAGAEDRHGREDEENGRHAAVCRDWHQEEENNPGSSRFHYHFFQLVSLSSHVRQLREILWNNLDWKSQKIRLVLWGSQGTSSKLRKSPHRKVIKIVCQHCTHLLLF